MIKDLKSENSFLIARQKALDTRLIELEETLFELRDKLGTSGDQKPFVSKKDRKRLNEALDIADSMLRRFGKMMRGLKEDAEDLASKLPKILD